MHSTRMTVVVCMLAGATVATAEERQARRYTVGLTTTLAAIRPWLHLGAETYVASSGDGGTDLLLQAVLRAGAPGR